MTEQAKSKEPTTEKTPTKESRSIGIPKTPEGKKQLEEMVGKAIKKAFEDTKREAKKPPEGITPATPTTTKPLGTNGLKTNNPPESPTRNFLSGVTHLDLIKKTLMQNTPEMAALRKAIVKNVPKTITEQLALGQTIKEAMPPGAMEKIGEMLKDPKNVTAVTEIITKQTEGKLPNSNNLIKALTEAVGTATKTMEKTPAPSQMQR